MVGSLLDRAIPACGEVIEYRPKSGGRYSLAAVFDRESIDIDPATGTIVSSHDPKIGVKVADMSDPAAVGDKVLILDTVFTVTDSVDDGQGGATLKLNKDTDF